MKRHASLLARGAAAILTVCLLSVRADADVKGYRFDFGPADQAVSDGFTGVGGRTVFSPDRGYGWVELWGVDYARPDEVDVLTRDGICARNHIGLAPKENDVTFRVRVPNGVYAVTVWLGDASRNEGRKGLCVATNGRVTLPPPGVGGWGTVTQRTLPAVVANEVLDVRFFVSGSSSSHRLSVLALAVEAVNDPAQRELMERKWGEDSAPVGAAEREITVDGRKLKEIGRRIQKPLGTLPEPWQGRALLTYTRPDPGDLLDYSVPRGEELTAALAAFAAPGDDRAFWFGVYAAQDVKDVRVHCSDFTNGRARIPNSAIELFTLTSRPRAVSDRPGDTAKIVSDLVEAYVPFPLSRDKTKPVYLRVRVPEGQTPGAYVAQVTLSPAGGKPVTVALSLAVIPLKVAPPVGREWGLFADPVRWYDMSREAVRDEIADMARHGITSLSFTGPPVEGAFIERNGRIVGADLGPIAEALRYAARLGMNGVVRGPSTPSMVNRFRGWTFGHKNGATHGFSAGLEGRAVAARHPGADASSSFAMVAGTPFPRGDSLRFAIRYKAEGAGGGVARLTFMKSYKRDAVAEGAVALRLAATGGEWRTLFETTTVPANARYGRVTLDYHGGPGALWVDQVDLLGPDGVVNHVVNPGFERDFDVVDVLAADWPQAFAEGFADALRATCQAVERCGLTPMIVGTDESGNNPKTIHKEVNEMKAARKAGYGTWCNLSPDAAEKMGDNLDVVCHYTSLLGDEDACRRLMKRYHASGRKLHYISAGAYVGQEFDLMPNRHSVGFCFWKSGCDGTAIWVYQRPTGDPYNDFDGAFKDYCLVLPPREAGGQAVPTLGWEGVREGWKDYCYVNALEEAVKRAGDEGRADAAALGRSVLESIRQGTPWFDQSADRGFDNAAADQLRWLAAWTAMKLNGMDVSGSTTGSDDGKAPDKSLAIRFATATAKVERPILCSFTRTAPEVDGRLGDAVWASAGKLEGFQVYTNKGVPAKAKTEVYLLHDADNLYLGFRCQEPNMKDLKAQAEGPDANVFADDSIEMFFDTANDEFNFSHLAFNASGARFDELCAGDNDFGANVFAADYGKKKIRDQKWNGDWRVKVSHHEDRWEAEVVLPFKTLGRASDLWGVHFARNRHAGARETSTPKVIGMFHQPARYAKMLLAGLRGGAAEWAECDIPLSAFGKSAFVARLRGAAPAAAWTEVTFADGAMKKVAARIADGNAVEFEYNLDSSARGLAFVAEDGAGHAAFRIQSPVSVPSPIVARSGRKVRFANDRAGEFVFALNLSERTRASARLVCRLLDGAGRALDEAAAPLGGAECRVDVNLEGRSHGAFALDLSVVDRAGERIAHRREGLVLVPHFTEVFTK